MAAPSGLTDVEVEYSPSLHSHDGKTPEEVIAEFLTNGEASYKDLLTKYEHELDVAYGDTEHEAQKYDVFFPQNAQKYTRIHLYIHGGYWQHMDRKLSGPVAKPFLDNGITVIFIGYVLATEIPLERLVHNVQRAVQDVAERHPSAELSVSGHSAGGHLVAKLLEVPELHDKLESALMIAPIFDLTPLVGTYVGEPIKLTAEQARSCSVDVKKLRDYPGRMVIVTARHDAPGFLDQARDAHEQLQKSGTKNIDQKIFDESHCTVITELYNPQSAVHQWVKDFFRR